ncbi:MAG: hypothetical protein AB7V77_04835 [Candidatus Woesearchaeota archaeon]
MNKKLGIFLASLGIAGYVMKSCILPDLNQHRASEIEGLPYTHVLTTQYENVSLFDNIENRDLDFKGNYFKIKGNVYCSNSDQSIVIEGENGKKHNFFIGDPYWSSKLRNAIAESPGEIIEIQGQLEGTNRNLNEPNLDARVLEANYKGENYKVLPYLRTRMYQDDY